MYYGRVLKVSMVRETLIPFSVRPILNTPAAGFTLFRQFYNEVHHGEAREVFSVAYLSVRHRLIALETVSIGWISGALVHPREVFTGAITAKASAIVLAHNHPNGVRNRARKTLR